MYGSFFVLLGLIFWSSRIKLSTTGTKFDHGTYTKNPSSRVSSSMGQIMYILSSFIWLKHTLYHYSNYAPKTGFPQSKRDWFDLPCKKKDFHSRASFRRIKLVKWNNNSPGSRISPEVFDKISRTENYEYLFQWGFCEVAIIWIDSWLRKVSFHDSTIQVLCLYLRLCYTCYPGKTRRL